MKKPCGPNSPRFREADFDLGTIGFNDEELRRFLAEMDEGRDSRIGRRTNQWTSR